MKAFFVLSILLASATIAEATCGTQGGPGLRNPNTGQCESWANLVQACGAGGCIREKVAPAADEMLRKARDSQDQRKQTSSQP